MRISQISKIVAGSLFACGAATFAQSLNLGQLPAPVQSVVQTETKNGPVNSIQQLNLNGHVVYQVGFQQGGGEKNIYLNPDGSYYQNTATASNSSVTNGIGGKGRSGRVLDMKIEQLPQNVQNVIKSEESNGPVEKIQQIPYNDRRVYRVTLKKPDGTQKLVYLNLDGSYVRDQPQLGSASAIGAPAASSTGTGLNSAPRVPLANAAKVTLDQVPPVAQNTIKAYAKGAAVEDIDKGTLGSRTVYEAAFKQNGQTVELRVDEQGRLIRDAQEQAIITGNK
jgi:uncharacterized membrane protein YkoI